MHTRNADPAIHASMRCPAATGHEEQKRLKSARAAARLHVLQHNYASTDTSASLPCLGRQPGHVAVPLVRFFFFLSFFFPFFCSFLVPLPLITLPPFGMSSAAVTVADTGHRTGEGLPASSAPQLFIPA